MLIEVQCPTKLSSTTVFWRRLRRWLCFLRCSSVGNPLPSMSRPPPSSTNSNLFSPPLLRNGLLRFQRLHCMNMRFYAGRLESQSSPASGHRLLNDVYTANAAVAVGVSTMHVGIG